MRVTRSPVNGDSSGAPRERLVWRKVEQLWSSAIRPAAVAGRENGLELRQPQKGRVKGVEHLQGVQFKELDLSLSKQKTD